jgi:hypothetical protein
MPPVETEMLSPREDFVCRLWKLMMEFAVRNCVFCTDGGGFVKDA